MAPEAAMPKRKPRENQYLFEVGVRGRKTGLTVPDTGIRDENGLEPMDHLFSSPEKPKSGQKLNGANKFVNGTLTSEEDMDVDENTAPELAAVLNERKQASMRLPPPRAKSPIKTFLQSPARRNPSLGPGSSPVRPAARAHSVSTSVRRKLDFSNSSFGSMDESAIIDQTMQRRAGSAMPGFSNAKLVTGNGAQASGAASSHLNEEFNGDDSMDGGAFNGDDSMQMVNGDSEIVTAPEEADEDEEEPEEEPEPEPKFSKKAKGKAKAVEQVEEKVAGNAPKRGRPKKAAGSEIQEAPEEEEEPVEQARPKKRTRASLNGSTSDGTHSPKSKFKKNSQQQGAAENVEEQPARNKGGRPKKVTKDVDAEEQPAKSKGGRPKKAPIEEKEEEPVSIIEQDDEEVEEPPKKRSRPAEAGPSSSKGTEKAKKAPAKTVAAKAKVGPRKPKLATIEEADSPAVQRGPPLPRTNNGLFILRRETPADGVGFKQTRSGRNSIKPVAFWKNERIEYEEDEIDDRFGKFLLPRIKEVVRAEENEQSKPKRARARSRAPKSRKATAEPESEDDDEVEPWEMEPGRISGAVRAWDPEDPTGAEVEEMEEEVALSSAAIITRDIAGASFKFAKTLSYPFFGAGMVDLPPGAQKKPKNSRRMQMAFFVFYGRVKVTINDTEFRIGKGGMFQVPRGNFYSLENDYDKPARIFFSQGCELPDADSQ